MAKQKRTVLLTADDFGASDFIDKGILSGIEKGLINNVAAMVNFPGSEEKIKELAARFPHVSIGLHVSITAGKPVSPPEEVPTLVDSQGRFFNIQEFLQGVTQINRTEVLRETQRQMELFRRWGIPLEHLSSHHNVMQVYSPLFRLLLHLASKDKIPIRSTRPLSRFRQEFSNSQTIQEGRKTALRLFGWYNFSAVKFIKYGSNREMQKNQDLMVSRGIPHCDYLADSFWGNPTPENLRHILHYLPGGTSELIFHLGSDTGLDEAPKGIDQDYFYYRDLELFCISSAELPHWLEREGIEQKSYRDLTTPTR